MVIIYLFGRGHLSGSSYLEHTRRMRGLVLYDTLSVGTRTTRTRGCQEHLCFGNEQAAGLLTHHAECYGHNEG